MFANSDFSDLLRLLNASLVRYLVIGGYAVVQYAEPRFTADLELWVGTEPRNVGAVYEALREFGAPLSGLTADDFAEEGYFYQMGVPPVRVDVLMGIPGVEFDTAWERRVEIDLRWSARTVHLARRPHHGKAGIGSAAGHDRCSISVADR